MLAACLLEWFPPPEEDVDARAAAFVVADTILRYRAALNPGKK